MTQHNKARGHKLIRGTIGRLTPKAYAYEVKKQDRRREAAALAGSVREGCIMLESEGTPEAIERRVRAEIARWRAVKGG